MYMVGAYIVSTLSGMRFADFVDNRIFKPLSMRSSTYSINTAIQTSKFTDTWTSFGRSIPHWNQAEFEDLMAGPAGVISSVEDLVRQSICSTSVFDSHLKQALWTRVFLNSGIDPATNVTIIPSAGFNAVTSAHSIADPGASAQFSTNVYGLGWGRLSYAGHDVSESCVFYPVRDIMLAYRLFSTTEVHPG
jgi:CubicO group peptidase (beta-lactamase class C family)